MYWNAICSLFSTCQLVRIKLQLIWEWYCCYYKSVLFFEMQILCSDSCYSTLKHCDGIVNWRNRLVFLCVLFCLNKCVDDWCQSHLCSLFIRDRPSTEKNLNPKQNKMYNIKLITLNITDDISAAAVRINKTTHVKLSLQKSAVPFTFQDTISICSSKERKESDFIFKSSWHSSPTEPGGSSVNVFWASTIKLKQNHTQLHPPQAFCLSGRDSEECQLN